MQMQDFRPKTKSAAENTEKNECISRSGRKQPKSRQNITSAE